MLVPDLRRLVATLADRAADAAIGRSRIVNPALREGLRDLLRVEAGKPGSFIADPVFEAVFGWQTDHRSLQHLADDGMLSMALVDALDRAAPIASEDGRSRNRFPRDRMPYRHQVQAWECLKAPTPRALVVSSGTGSGKTECFLVPILDDLMRQSETEGRLVGVQALFLYPLNALIASQEDRLADWTEPSGGDVRFALYNGHLPEQVSKAEADRTPWKVADRQALRTAPPPLLVTNATMLEYMLVRAADTPILRQSQGRLRWVVLDEAHTYVGSQAAEMTLLLRRTLHAFGVRPDEVRFVATSATLGQRDEDRAALRAFLAALSGRSEEGVDLIEGERDVPPLVPDGHGGLTADRIAVRLRERLAPRRATLAELAPLCEGRDPLEVLRACGVAPDEDGSAFLPLRLHLFHRSQAGVWACIDPDCPGRAGTRLADPVWPFGAIAARDAQQCAACGALLLPILLCDKCGAPFLEAAWNAERTRLTRVRDVRARDAFVPEDDPDNEADDDVPPPEDARVLLAPPGLRGESRLSLDRVSGELADAWKPGLVRLSGHLPMKGCPCCGAGHSEKRRLFRPLRLSGQFLAGAAANVLLDAAPAAEPDDLGAPHGGRQMISFTDNRQGTARFAASWQQEAERNYVRATLLHAVHAGDPDGARKAEQIHAEISALEDAVRKAPDVAATLGPSLRNKKAERDKLNAASLPWAEAKRILAARNADDSQHPLMQLWQDRDARFARNDELASLQLHTEFLRRPVRGNNLETMGLVGLRFDGIESATDMPPLFRDRGATEQEWRDFLSIAVTHLVRAQRAVQIVDSLRNWVGQQANPRVYVPADPGPTELRWPAARPGAPRSRLVRVLKAGFALDFDDVQTRHLANDALLAAFRQLRAAVGMPHLEGLQLDLTRTSLVRIDAAWICPITLRLLDRCFRGFSPFIQPNGTTHDAQCRKVEMPRLPRPWLRAPDGTDRRAETEAWLAEDVTVDARRRDGVWTDLHDRLALLAPFVRVAEHSAQLPSWRLRDYERAFKRRRINALTCSTTMEMGVDIGGIGTVLMTNVPPSPASYRQRVGRAGRRGEKLAIALTYCPDDPLGWSVFDAPATPLDRPIRPPRVALESRAIVRRHVNAFLLGAFLRSPTCRSPQDRTRLPAEWFFVAQGEAAAPVEAFGAWLRDRPGDMALMAALRTVVAGSALTDDPDLPDRCAAEIANIATAWRRECDALVADHDSVGGAAQRALKMQLQRLNREFLLTELTSRAFLPGHGFPTGIVSFIAMTPAERDRNREDRREDRGGGRARDYPSRGIDMAIREYAPGSDVVIDGLVYRSAGITLNWHRPASEAEAQEVQSIGHLWRCGCGGAGWAQRRPEQCSACGRPDPHVERALEPAGFSMDFGADPTNDIEQVSFVPVVDPHVAASGAAWVALDDPASGRVRATPEGLILGVSRGQNGHGYAICLSCGRAEPEMAEAGATAPVLGPHKPLRPGREMKRCDPVASPFAVQRNLRLGYRRRTDVCELQLADLPDEATAVTVAIALREGLARQLGIERDELGWGAERRPGAMGGRVWSLLLFDSAAGGAGYASSAPSDIPGLVTRALEVLDCRNPGCSTACPACLIVRDTLAKADALDRMRGIAFLQRLQAALVLPATAAVFGAGVPGQRMTQQPLAAAIRAALQRPGMEELLLTLPGLPAEWDLGGWWAATLAVEAAREGRRVTLAASATALAGAGIDARLALFALTARGGSTLRVRALGGTCQRL